LQTGVWRPNNIAPALNSVRIAENHNTAPSSNVNINIDASDDLGELTEMLVQNDDSVNQTWEPFAPIKNWTLRPGEGTQWVMMTVRDANGNESARVTDSVFVDFTPPTGTIKINDGAATTASRDVQLQLSISDSSAYLKDIRVSNDGVTWADWRPYTTSLPWTLALGADGQRTVSVLARDEAGNVSPPISASITLTRVAGASCDPRPPVKVSTSPVGAGRLKVTVTAGSGSLTAVQVANGGNWTIESPPPNPLPSGTSQVSFVVQRTSPGAVTVPLTVTDHCGQWKTFVGGGAAAF